MHNRHWQMVFNRARQQLVMLLTACLTMVLLRLEQSLQAASTQVEGGQVRCIIPEFQYVQLFQNANNQPCGTLCTDKAAEAVAWWNEFGSDICQREHYVNTDYYPPRASIGNVMSKVAVLSDKSPYLYWHMRNTLKDIFRHIEPAPSYCSCNVTVILSNIPKLEDWPDSKSNITGLCSLQALALRSAPRGPWQLASLRYLSELGFNCEMKGFENILGRPLITFTLPFTQNTTSLGIPLTKSEKVNEAKRWLAHAAFAWI